MKENFNSDTNKIRCRNCSNCDINVGICNKKKKTVKLNKTRYCSMFMFDENIFMEREKKAAIARRQASKNIVVQPIMPGAPVSTKASSHPLTGDLSRFTTTGSV